MADPYIKFFPSDFLGGTSGLSPAERGVYITLLCLARKQGEHVLVSEDKRLALSLNVNVRTWRRHKSALVEMGLILQQDGHLVLLRTFERRDERTPIPIAVRRAVIERDGHACRYCGDTSGPFEFDHVLPWSRGGRETVENIVRACVSCNRAKADRTPEEMGWAL